VENKAKSNQQSDFAAFISKENDALFSPSFRIIFSGEEVSLNLVGQFRTSIDPVTIYDRGDFFIDVALFWTKYLPSQIVLPLSHLEQKLLQEDLPKDFEIQGIVERKLLRVLSVNI
jgi:hypothetical protein